MSLKSVVWSRHSGFVVLSALAGLALSGCGGGGGGSGSGTAPTVTITGKITFDRIPFKASPQKGLNPDAPIQSPARLVVLEALDASSQAVLASTTTSDTGDYSISIAQNTNVIIRAKAQMLKQGAAPTWNFRVLNNTNGDALYALDSSSFDTGTVNSTHNLNAASGWGTTSYTGTRAAAPFAVLDTVYSARQLVLSAVASSVFPDLNLYWSATNKPTVNTFCTSSGDIGTTFYTNAAPNADNCIDGGALAAGIYVLGDFTQGDTDEFDQHVIAHEFGHYLEDRFSRSDSIGGSHNPGDKLDLRLAYSEGWGNAYSGMALNDPVYRDSQSGVSSEGGFNLETDVPSVHGWYSEGSIGGILWDIFDSGTEAGDTVALGFAPIFSVLTGSQATSDALTSIFEFAAALRTANPNAAQGIDDLLTRESISTGSDAFGNAETNSGGSVTALPIYRDVALNAPTAAVCVGASAGSSDNNKLGNRRFLRLTLTSPMAVTITATGAVDPADTNSVAATDPDMVLYHRGFLQRSEATGQTETISQQPLASGVYIIELYDFDLGDTGVGTKPHCMSVSVTG
jgi:hypothetical protein